MCGIAGIFDAVRRPEEQDLRRMVDIQRHRGPDSDGFLACGALAMGMRRLSIIDVEGGDQPVFNEDRSVAVVLNGEIYNYIELRDELAALGHRFATRSDTEVLVHLWEEHGPSMLPKLNGMFGFALWDARSRSLLLARDRMGVKPLYYARAGSRWLFASELKALLTQCGLDDELDLDALADFLRLCYIPRDATPYRRIRRLLPGHYLLLEPEKFELRAWWDLAEGAPSECNREPERLAPELRCGFDDAVRLRMRSDVPVAAFLSGGLDSSLVTITAQRQSALPIRTFTLTFEQTEFDEAPYARAVAEHAGTEHRELSAGVEDALAHLPLLVWHMDEPMGDSSIIPNYLISRFAAMHGKVCLSGLGGDELFGGYSRYFDPGPGRLRRVFAHAPAVARALARLLDPWRYSSAEELRLAGDPSLAWRRYLHQVQVVNSRRLRDCGFPARGRAEDIIESLWNRCPVNDPVCRRQFIDQQTYLPDQILALTDRMSMANSLEVRVPFMDYRLVRLAQHLGSAAKQNANDYKIFLKRVLGDRCPPQLLSRPKWGFDTPLSRWAGRPEVCAAILRAVELLGRQRLLEIRRLRQMLSGAPAVSRFARWSWNLLVLAVWLKVRDRCSPPGETLAEVLS